MADLCRVYARTPIFEKGRILKKDAIEELRDFPRTVAALQYQGYTDGILYGFEPSSVGPDQIQISSGMLIHHGNVILIHDAQRLTIPAHNMRLLLVLRVEGFHQELDFNVYTIEFMLVPFRELQAGEYELARFLLEDGAKLRGIPDYLGIGDFATEFNTLCYLSVQYAGARSPSIPKSLLQCFAQTLVQQGSLEPLDQMICLQILSGSLEREGILYYLSQKNQTSYRDYSNLEVYEQLHRICLTAQKLRAPAKSPNQGRRTFID